MTATRTCPNCEQTHGGRGPGATYGNCPTRDDRAIAYYTGAADARHGRPRRVDLADVSLIGAAYTRGYNATAVTL